MLYVELVGAEYAPPVMRIILLSSSSSLVDVSTKNYSIRERHFGRYIRNTLAVIMTWRVSLKYVYLGMLCKYKNL